ncbi:hypothetical protein DO021_12425 [Desulfobacter hydrogenophilus]|uniref:Uncharacterized protein n=1 Tax=Desulfobacter hydrogenophilus TaxID=2291 RepID=A0A328FFA6_9BACT|nr:hypothetical protein DO021_12425 [Desulfobacter hydrogenophilus]
MTVQTAAHLFKTTFPICCSMIFPRKIDIGMRFIFSYDDIVSERKPVNFVEYKADANFNRRNTWRISRIKICAQRINRQKLRFSVGQYIGTMVDVAGQPGQKALVLASCPDNSIQYYLDYTDFLNNSHGLTWSINTEVQPTTKHESNSVTYWNFHIKSITQIQY